MSRRSLTAVAAALFVICAAIFLSLRTESLPPARGVANDSQAPVPVHPGRIAEVSESRQVAGAQAAHPLVREASFIFTTAPSAGLAVPPHAKRHRWVQVPGDLFTAKRSPIWAPKGERLLELNLFPDMVLPVVIEHAEVLGKDRYAATGVIEGRAESRVLMTMAGDSLTVSVSDPELGRYVVEGSGPGHHIAYEIDMDFVGECSGGLQPFLDQDAMQEVARRMSSIAEPSESGAPPMASYQAGTPIVDVMVAYSTEVLAAEGLSNILSRIDNAFLEANSDFVRSGIAARVRLVHTVSVIAQENGSFDNALERIRKTDDGIMDGVHALRTEHGADLVTLIVNRSGGGVVGQAYLLTTPWSFSNQAFAFNSVQWSFLTGTSTFTHEIGHNLGCAHSRHDSASPGAYSYAYGYKFNDSSNTLWRTIMAYAPGARSGYFSNPRLTSPPSIPGNVRMGVPAGQAGEADNALTVDQTAFEVANFRLNTKDPYARGNLINVSTRAIIGTDERQMIGGFIVEGPAKTVLVRSMGPSLIPPPFNLTGALVDPKIEVIPLGQSVAIAANDDYVTSADLAAIRATGFAPADSREPAVLLTLNPGGYTALVSGKGGATGIGLVEVYEVGRAGNRIVNLSTRGWVSVDSDVMIGGFIIQGNPGETKRLLVRVLGPTLADFGVNNALFDPAARLYNNSSELLLDNDDWDAGPHQDKIRALNLAPGNRREPAMLLDLAPGAYTVIVRPFENPPPDGASPGIALIEVYEITTDP